MDDVNDATESDRSGSPPPTGGDPGQRVWEIAASERARLVALARRRLADPSMAEDVVHDALEGAIRYCRATGLGDRDRVVGVICTRIGWRAGELNRRVRRLRERTVPLDQAAPAVASPERDGQAAAEAAELREAMLEVLARVPARVREAVALRVLQELPVSAVAARTGLRERQAARAVERALARLRALYLSRALGHFCQEASELLPLLAAGTLGEAVGAERAGLVRRHAEGCLRCRMERRFYRRGAALAPVAGVASTIREAAR